MTTPSASDLNEPVTIVPYDQQWSTLYSDEQKIISNGNTSLLPYSAAKDSFITELKLDALEWQSNLQATNKDLPI